MLDAKDEYGGPLTEEIRRLSRTLFCLPLPSFLVAVNTGVPSRLEQGAIHRQ
jgi:hypothetical protein